MSGACAANDAVRVRPLQVADIDAVCAIQAVCYQAVTPESPQSLAAKIAAAPASCFLALVAGKPAGYVIAVPWRAGTAVPLDAPTCVLPPAPDCLYIHDMAVDPAAGRAGIGSRLMAPVLAAAQVGGLTRQCLVAIQGADAFWRRHGFQAVSDVSADLAGKLAGYGPGALYMMRQAPAGNV